MAKVKMWLGALILLGILAFCGPIGWAVAQDWDSSLTNTLLLGLFMVIVAVGVAISIPAAIVGVAFFMRGRAPVQQSDPNYFQPALPPGTVSVQGVDYLKARKLETEIARMEWELEQKRLAAQLPAPAPPQQNGWYAAPQDGFTFDSPLSDVRKPPRKVEW